MARNPQYRSQRSTPQAPTRQKDISEEKRLQGWLALQAFRKLIPTLTTYVRALSGNPTLKVIASAEDTATDGKVVYIRPPLELGSNTPHQRTLCNKRTDNGRQACPACDARELVMGSIYHELAHVIFGTHEVPIHVCTDAFSTFIDRCHPPGTCDHGKIIKAHAFNKDANNYLNMMFALHPKAQLILNALEDARVNAGMFQARPGTRAMMRTTTAEVFANGTGQYGEQADDDLWQDRPLELQVIIGLFLAASNYDTELNMLHEDARAALADPKLRSVISSVTSAVNIHDLFLLCVRVIERLLELGCLDIEVCKKKDEVENEESGDGPGTPGSSSDSSDTSQQSDSSQSNSSGSGQDQESVQPDEGSGSAGDTSNVGDPGSDDRGEDSNPETQTLDDNTSSADTEDESDSSDVPVDSNSSDSKDSDDDEPRERGDSSGEDSSDDGSSSDGSSSGDSRSGNSSGESDNPPSGDGAGTQQDDSTESQADGDGGWGSSSSSDGDVESSGGHGESVEPMAGDDSSPTGGTDSNDSDSGGNPPGAGEPDAGEPDAGEPTEYTPSRIDGESECEAAPLPEENTIKSDGKKIEIFSPSEDIANALKQISLHSLLDDNPNMEKFASGDSVLTHAEHGQACDEDIEDWIAVIADALLQSGFFDTSSKTVSSTRLVSFSNLEPSDRMWGGRYQEVNNFTPPESIVGRTLLKARVAFDLNRAANKQTNRTSGKINSRTLATRAPLADPRMMYKRTIPGKRDHVVVIGMDISGSQELHDRLSREKRSVFAQASVLSRLGVKFEIWAHSGYYADPKEMGPDEHGHECELVMIQIKTADEPWSTTVKTRLANLIPRGGNLDGHSLEFLRKRLERLSATDKSVIYYTDGAMPAMNYDEELEILQREIQTCKQRGYALLAVGIDTDSPERHGFDTVQVKSDSDLPLVMEQLGRRFTQ